MTAYENFLRGPDLKEKKGVRTFVDGEPVSAYTEPGAVFSFTRQKAGTSVVHLINFKGASSKAWVDSRGVQTPPVIMRDITVTQPVERRPEAVWMASPDYRKGIAKELDFTYENGTVTFTLPYLEYWDMIVIR